MKALIVNSGDRHGIDAIRVTIEIALIPMSSAIPTGKDEDRALSPSTIVNTVYESFLDEITRALHGLAVVGRAPATAIDRNVMETEVKRSCFVYV